MCALVKICQSCRLQEFAVRELKKERQPGDPNKFDELQLAGEQLTQAWRFFTQQKALLDQPGKHSLPADKKKLAAHLAFCAATFKKATVTTCPKGLFLPGNPDSMFCLRVPYVHGEALVPLIDVDPVTACIACECLLNLTKLLGVSGHAFE